MLFELIEKLLKLETRISELEKLCSDVKNIPEKDTTEKSEEKIIDTDKFATKQEVMMSIKKLIEEINKKDAAAEYKEKTIDQCRAAPFCQGIPGEEEHQHGHDEVKRCDDINQRLCPAADELPLRIVIVDPVQERVEQNKRLRQDKRQNIEDALPWLAQGFAADAVNVQEEQGTQRRMQQEIQELPCLHGKESAVAVQTMGFCKAHEQFAEDIAGQKPHECDEYAVLRLTDVLLGKCEEQYGDADQQSAGVKGNMEQIHERFTSCRKMYTIMIIAYSLCFFNSMGDENTKMENEKYPQHTADIFRNMI